LNGIPRVVKHIRRHVLSSLVLAIGHVTHTAAQVTQTFAQVVNV
jgi:hypothetical protein